MQLEISFSSDILSLRHLRSSADLSLLVNASEEYVSMYVQALTCMLLHRIPNALRAPACYSFFIACDGVTVDSSSWIDLRVRFHTTVKMCCFYFFDIPVYGSQTGEAMYHLICILLDRVVGLNWELKRIGISTDGTPNMVGKISVAVTRLELDCLRGICRIWCWVYQIDLGVQTVVVEHMTHSFQNPIDRLIAYLRRQSNLI